MPREEPFSVLIFPTEREGVQRSTYKQFSIPATAGMPLEKDVLTFSEISWQYQPFILSPKNNDRYCPRKN
jgi:hypothetical protein